MKTGDGEDDDPEGLGCALALIVGVFLFLVIVYSIKHERQDNYILDLQRRVAELEQKKQP